MSKFNPGVRVFVIDENHEMKKGVINAIHEAVSIAIVKFDDGNVEKVNINSLGIWKEEPTEKEHTEPVEKSEITITPEEFRNVSTSVLEEMTEDQPLVGSAITLYLVKLHRALFFDAVDND